MLAQRNNHNSGYSDLQYSIYTSEVKGAAQSQAKRSGTEERYVQRRNGRERTNDVRVLRYYTQYLCIYGMTSLCNVRRPVLHA